MSAANDNALIEAGNIIAEQERELVRERKRLDAMLTISVDKMGDSYRCIDRFGNRILTSWHDTMRAAIDEAIGQ